MILYAALFCVGIGMHLSQVLTDAQSGLTEECEAVYYVAATRDMYESRASLETLEKLELEYPLYLGTVCISKEHHIHFQRAPEAAFYRKPTNVVLERVNRAGLFTTLIPLPWDDREWGGGG